MSDYYGLPISTPPGPPGITAPNVASLYQSAVPSASGGVSGLTNLLGRAPEALGSFRGPAMLGGTGELGLMGVARAAAPSLILSQLATAGVNSTLPPSDARQVLGDAITGAGVGGAIGSVVPVVGTGVGAAVGGAGGALYGLADSFFGGDDSKPDYKQSLAQAASSFGLDPSTYTTAFDLLSKSGVDEKSLSTQLAQQLLSDASTKKQVDLAQQQAIQQHAGDQKFALAMQAQAQQFFTPYVNNIITAGQSQADLLKQQADTLPAPYRDVMLNQASQALTQSQRLAGAYAAQTAMLPSQYMYSQDLKRQQELATLQYQQSVVNAQQGGSNADFSSLVQQLAGQSAGG